MEILYEVYYNYHTKLYNHVLEYSINKTKYRLTLTNNYSKLDNETIYRLVSNEIQKTNKIIYVRRY